MAYSIDHEMLKSIWKKENNDGGIPFKDLLNSKGSCEVLSQTDYKAYSSALKSFSSKSSQTLPEPSTDGQVDSTKVHQNLVNPAFPGKTLQMKKNLSKETSCEKDPLDPLSEWNSITKFLECYNIKPFSEETAANGINRLSQEFGSIGEIPIPSDIPKSLATGKVSKSSSDNKLNSPVLSGIRNASKVNEALPEESLESPFDLPICKKFYSLLASENTEIPDFQHDGNKNNEENHRTFPFLSSKDYCEDNIRTSSNYWNFDLQSALRSLAREFDPLYPFLTPSGSLLQSSNKDFSEEDARDWPFPSSNYQNFDLQSAVRSSAREFDPLYPLRPSVPLRKSSNKTFKEMLTDLENWVSRGMNNVFNRPKELSSEIFLTNLEKDLKNGLNMMREMKIRLYSLMRAVRLTLDSDLKFLPGFEGIQIDLEISILRIWTVIENIESEVNEDYKKVELACENIAGKCTVKMEQGVIPNSFITNSYNIVTVNLPLIRKEFAKFRKMINVVCSEIEKRS